MDRKEAIMIIESLYPADSEFEESQKIGIKLMEQAKRDCNNWRNLPDPVLFRYAELCEEYEREAERRSFCSIRFKDKSN